MNKKLIRIVSIFLCLLMVLSVTVTASVSVPSVTESKPLVCYTYNSSGKVYAYKKSDLKTKTGGYISCSTDECKIIEITKNAVKVKYPTGNSSYKTAWFKRDEFTKRDLKSEGAKFKFVAQSTATVYKWKGKNDKLGSIAKKDGCYLLRGDENSDWLQIIYPISNGYKMGWIKNADYKKILPVAKSIKLDRTSVMLWDIGAKTTLIATVSPSEAIDKTVKWSSSNTKVATVSSSGEVTAKGSGQTIITAKTANGLTAKATVNVTVLVQIVEKAVYLDKTSATLKKGNTLKLKATVDPTDATYKTITWSSSDNSVASVSNDGVVTAKDAGTTIITATSKNGKKATCKITVPVVYADSIKLSKSSLDLKVGDTYTVKATLTPSDSVDKIKWSTSNSSVATVSSGKITAKKAGTATITATSENGKKAVCKIKVTSVYADSIKLNKSSLELNVGDTYTVKATLTPSDSVDKIKWSTSDSSVATVSSGKITAKKAGTATITAKIENGKKSTVKVTVIKKEESSWGYPMKNIYCTWKDKTDMSWSGRNYSSSRKDRPDHLGIDVYGTSGNVYAASGGKVVACSSSNKGANGRYIIIEHSLDGKKIYSFYAHLSTIKVKKGDSVSKGENIAKAGGSGYGKNDSYGTHLHFAVVDTLWSSGGYYGYADTFSGDKKKYENVTYYNPVYVIKNESLPDSYVSGKEIDKAAKNYKIDKNSNAYKALTSINTKYASKLSTTEEKGVNVFLFEGVGNDSNKNKRLNAMCVIVKNKKIVYISKNCSTIPDYPFEPSSNDGTDVPTLKSGIYSFKTVNHKGNYAALRVNNAKVVRFKSKSKYYTSTSDMINVHRRYRDTIPALSEGWVNSQGCMNIGKTGTSSSSEYAKFIQSVGIVGSSAKATAKYSKSVKGKIIIDRVYAAKYLEKVGYKSKAIEMIG